MSRLDYCCSSADAAVVRAGSLLLVQIPLLGYPSGRSDRTPEISADFWERTIG